MPRNRRCIHIVEHEEQMMRPKADNREFWDHIVLMVPYNFEAAAREAAHRASMPITEYSANTFGA
jgi:hypothetical protein